MSIDLVSRLNSYKNVPVILDTNLLIPLIVAQLTPQWRSHKRTKQFLAIDLEVIQACLGLFGPLVTTPHILTELSDFLGNYDSLFRIKKMVKSSKELYEPSELLVDDEQFCFHGLADIASISATKNKTILFSNEQILVNLVLSRGGQAISLDEARTVYKIENPIFPV